MDKALAATKIIAIVAGASCTPRLTVACCGENHPPRDVAPHWPQGVLPPDVALGPGAYAGIDLELHHPFASLQVEGGGSPWLEARHRGEQF